MGQLPTQVLEVQLTLSQLEGQIVPQTLLLAHPALGSFLRHWSHFVKVMQGHA